MTRDDVDPERLVYFGHSLGAIRAPAALVAEPRFKAAVSLAGGYAGRSNAFPEIQAYHFAPHVKMPVLMINGVQNGVQHTLIPYDSAQLPLFEDLGSNIKKHVTLMDKHNPDANDVFREMTSWLEQIFDSDSADAPR